MGEKQISWVTFSSLTLQFATEFEIFQLTKLLKQLIFILKCNKNCHLLCELIQALLLRKSLDKYIYAKNFI